MKPKTRKNPESIVREIKRKTRRKFNSEEKIRIVCLQMVLDRCGLKLREGFTSHILLSNLLCKPKATIFFAA
jgi:hypothetical protein